MNRIDVLYKYQKNIKAIERICLGGHQIYVPLFISIRKTIILDQNTEEEDA